MCHLHQGGFPGLHDQVVDLMLTLPHQRRDGVAAGQHSLALPGEYLCHLQQHVVGQNVPEIKHKHHRYHQGETISLCLFVVALLSFIGNLSCDKSA